MKLLRFRYILPVSVFMIVISMMIAYAKINWDSDPVGVWHGPQLASPLNDPIASFTTDREDFDHYDCPPPPPIPIVIPPGGGGPGGGGPGGPDPIPEVVIVIPPYVPPVTGDQSDSF